MLANDKILFVSDLAAYEDKTLIFYLGASSLSSFPIIVGYNGSVMTADAPDLELGYVLEVLASGYFDASVGSDKNILYKEGAFKMNISAADTLRVAALNATGDEQWEVHYSSFTSGEHTVYVMANGLVAHLYVDDFDVAKDTANLFESTNALLSSTNDIKLDCLSRRTFYSDGLYWAFYMKSGSEDIYYKTSSDGSSWSSEYTISAIAGDTNRETEVWPQGGYAHIVYAASRDGQDYIRYRRGNPESDSSITWSAAWQNIATPDANQYPTLVSIAVDTDGYPFIVYGTYYNAVEWLYITKSSTNDGTWSTEGGYPIQVDSGGSTHVFNADITSYPYSDKMYGLFVYDGELYGRYYNGTSWIGGDETIDAAGGSDICHFSAVADVDDNVYIVWTFSCGGGPSKIYLRIRYANGTFSNTVAVVDGDEGRSPSIVYNDELGYIYIIYYKTDTYDIKARCLAGDTLSGEWTIVDTLGGCSGVPPSATPYESDNIGILYVDCDGYTYHSSLSFPWDWNDNSNNWTWMQNNSMSYADYLIMGVDGEAQLEYQPDSIIQGTTLPDEEGDHDGTITWGSNPSGVDVSHSELMCETEDEEGTGYYYFEPGSQDIIKPEPEAMTGDVDLERLRDNPLYPLVQMLSIDGFLNERLVWLGIAWFIVVAAMLGVHLGFDTRKNTEKPQHFVLTTITGLGLSIVFYTMGIFDLWVIIMMGILLGGAIVWERQPVI